MHKPSADRNFEHAATDPHTALVPLVRALARSAARVQLRGKEAEQAVVDGATPKTTKREVDRD